MSATSSARSSRLSTPNGAEDDIAAAERLAALERMLQAQMGYSFGEEEAWEIQPAAEDESPHEKLELVIEGSAVKAAEPAPAEEVAFRLFSTQKSPQTVVIREAEDDWPSVKDPRIRDVSDEEKSVVKARRMAIAALAVDGSTIRAESVDQPLSRFTRRVATRRIVQPEPKAPRRPLPSLAYLKADLPSAPNPRSVASTSTTAPPLPLKRRRRPAQPKRQELRRPLSALEDVPLIVVTLSNSQMPVASPVVQKAVPVKVEKPKGNKRLSKARRELARKKLGKNAKKNKRKKAKAKAKAVGTAA